MWDGSSPSHQVRATRRPPWPPSVHSRDSGICYLRGVSRPAVAPDAPRLCRRHGRGSDRLRHQGTLLPRRARGHGVADPPRRRRDERRCRTPLARLAVDGRMTVDNVLMQTVADVLDVPVVRPTLTETVAWGAAYAAGLGAGFWPDRWALRRHWRQAAEWNPTMDPPGGRRSTTEAGTRPHAADRAEGLLTGGRGPGPAGAATARSPAESQVGASSTAVVRDGAKSWVSALEPGQGSHCKAMAQSRVVGVGASPYVALAGVPLFPVDHLGGLAMSRRFGFRPFAVGLAVIVVVGMTAPAVAAPPAAGSKPTPQSIFNKKFNGQISTQEAEGGGDEAEMVRLRGEFQQSITAAPAVVAPAAGLVEARRQAERMPTFGGSWNEVTDKPFLNDPIPRGANYGVGHYIITGRMTAFTSTSDAVYAGSASGGVWRTTDKGVTWQPVNAGLPRLAIGALATDPSDGSVWVGTGEANNASENQYGVGVYRLARGTDTW